MSSTLSDPCPLKKWWFVYMALVQRCRAVAVCPRWLAVDLDISGSRVNASARLAKCFCFLLSRQVRRVLCGNSHIWFSSANQPFFGAPPFEIPGQRKRTKREQHRTEHRTEEGKLPITALQCCLTRTCSARSFSKWCFHRGQFASQNTKLWDGTWGASDITGVRLACSETNPAFFNASS